MTYFRLVATQKANIHPPSLSLRLAAPGPLPSHVLSKDLGKNLRPPGRHATRAAMAANGEEDLHGPLLRVRDDRGTVWPD